MDSGRGLRALFGRGKRVGGRDAGASARERAGVRAGRRRERDTTPSARRSRRARRRNQRSELTARVLVALPAIVVAALSIAAGGLWFTLAAIGLGLVALHELYTLMRRVQPVKLAGFVALIALALTALYGGHGRLVLVLAASFPLTFLLALARPRREDVSWAIAATTFGVLWIGLAVSHAVLLRELPHGAALLTDVLVGTFVGDTCAYAAGRAWGTRRLAPLISPNKTLEGLLAGILGGTFAFWAFAFAYQHEWLAGTDALLIGFLVAIAAPVGDLFESLIKRDLEVKDSGRFFGAHGGVLDRLDAVFFTVVVGYYASVALL